MFQLFVYQFEQLNLQMYISAFKHSYTYNGAFTLNGAPRVLPGPDSLVADLNEVRAADDCEGDVRVHSAIDFSHRLVVNRELVDLYAVRLQLMHYL